MVLCTYATTPLYIYFDPLCSHTSELNSEAQNTTCQPMKNIVSSSSASSTTQFEQSRPRTSKLSHSSSSMTSSMIQTLPQKAVSQRMRPSRTDDGLASSSSSMIRPVQRQPVSQRKRLSRTDKNQDISCSSTKVVLPTATLPSTTLATIALTTIAPHIQQPPHPHPKIKGTPLFSTKTTTEPGDQPPPPLSRTPSQILKTRTKSIFNFTMKLSIAIVLAATFMPVFPSIGVGAVVLIPLASGGRIASVDSIGAGTGMNMSVVGILNGTGLMPGGREVRYVKQGIVLGPLWPRGESGTLDSIDGDGDADGVSITASTSMIATPFYPMTNLSTTTTATRTTTIKTTASTTTSSPNPLPPYPYPTITTTTATTASTATTTTTSSAPLTPPTNATLAAITTYCQNQCTTARLTCNAVCENPATCPNDPCNPVHCVDDCAQCFGREACVDGCVGNVMAGGNGGVFYSAPVE